MEASRTTNICMISVLQACARYCCCLNERERERQEVMDDEPSRECYMPFWLMENP